jgi:hypothetical protein
LLFCGSESYKSRSGSEVSHDMLSQVMQLMQRFKEEIAMHDLT